MDEVQQTRGSDGSAHTTGRKSARNRPIEIITRGERRRSWTWEQKREIVAESLGPELTPSEVARKHAISSGQLYTWRRQLLAMPGAVIERAMRKRGRSSTSIGWGCLPPNAVHDRGRWRDGHVFAGGGRTYE